MAVFIVSAVDLLEHILDFAPVPLFLHYELVLLHLQPPIFLLLAHEDQARILD